MSQINKELDVFSSALERAIPAERAAYLDGVCGGDAEMRARVEALLQAHAQAGGFLPAEVNQPPAGALGKTMMITSGMIPVSEKPGDHIGRYKLLQKIGEGGCGVVYMAEQSEPVRRRVALKVIKLGMDTKSVIARFEAERQALALMDHPNIAKVLDAGATDTGRPFFVMELVRGIKISEYCDQKNLSTRARLDVFLQVCQAVQHAHQKGIIHRDLKPSNILVADHDGLPVPKVIDFGIAKATTDQQLTDKTLFTAFEQFIGTPAYMSPEQANLSGLDIDTRTDIYSLGVLLYELLTGETPFDAKELLAAGLEEMRRTIREQEPARPSTCLSTMLASDLTTVAKHRQAEPAKLTSTIQGDLDWIVMKALEKDRQRRYETANGLAADIRRHLNNEPVVARPPSLAYRVHKAVRRNKLACGAGTAVAAALLVGILISSWQARIAVRALAQTEKSRQAEKEQRLAAQQERDKATAAKSETEAARNRAEAESYAADIYLADEAVKANNFDRARQLLARHRPVPGQPDLRNWEWRYLWQKCRSDALTKLFTQNGLALADVSCDGRWLAVGGFIAGKITVFDISDLKAPRTVAELPLDKINIQLVCSPRDPVVAYSDSDGFDDSWHPRHLIHLWNFQTQKELRSWSLTNTCLGLAFSPDGKGLVTMAGNTTGGPKNAELAVWRCADGAKLASFPATPGIGFNLGNLVVSPDNSLAAYCGNSRNQLIVADLATGTNRWTATLAVPPSVAPPVAISPDGTLLVAAENLRLRFWDPATGAELEAPLATDAGQIMNLRFLPDGRTLVSGGYDHTIRLWDTTDPRHVHPKWRPLRGNESMVVSLAVLPDGRSLISGGNDGSVNLWDLTAEPLNNSEVVIPEAGDWHFSPDSHSVLALETNRVVQWQGTRFQEQRHLFDLSADMDKNIFLKDGRRLVSRSTNGFLQVCELPSGKLSRPFGDYAATNPPIEFYNAGRNVLLLRNSNQLDLWNLDKLEMDGSLPFDVAMGRINFYTSDSGKWLFKRSYGEVFTRINPATRESITKTLALKEAFGMVFSRDDRLFASGSSLGYAGVWETDSFRSVAVVGSGQAIMEVVGFSPDGTRLLTWDEGTETLRLWDLKTQRELLVLEHGHDGSEFSPDGNILGGNCDYSIHLYRAPTLAEIDATEQRDAVQNPPMGESALVK